MLTQIEKIIEIQKAKVRLLEEYRESFIYEQCDHKVEEYSPGRFILYKLPEGVEVSHGDAIAILKWINRRSTLSKTYHSHKVILGAKALVLKDFTAKASIARLASTDDEFYYYETTYDNWKVIEMKISKLELKDAPFEIKATQLINYIQWK